MSWEASSYQEYFSLVSDKFKKETKDYLEFMEKRHKITTLDYIATLESNNKMLNSRISHLEFKIRENTPKETWHATYGISERE